MKAPTRRRTTLFAALALAALLLGGCWADRLVWSPDGRRAAVITDDGLYLADSGGQLLPLLVPQVYLAAWLGDSQQLVVARQRPVADWASVAGALGNARAAEIAAKAEFFWGELQRGRTLNDARNEEELGVEADAAVLYLRERHPDDLQRMAGAEWKGLASLKVALYTVNLARIEADRIVLGPQFYQELARVADLRPAPDGRALAFTTSVAPHADSNYELFAAPLDDATPPVVVARDTAAHPDWTPDGLTLAYLQAADAAGSGDLRLGTLDERGVVVAGGQIRLAKEPQAKASVIFQVEDRVRCLKDGRILFNAAVYQWPAPADDPKPAEQLFSFVPGKRSAVVPLLGPAELAKLSGGISFFAVSPDERQVVLGQGDGGIELLELSDGRIETIASHAAVMGSLQQLMTPGWRRPGEFTYVKAFTYQKGGGRRAAPNAEVVLHGPDGEKILSRDWADSLMKRFFSVN